MDAKTMDRVAELARLDLTPAEKAQYLEQLKGIIEFVEQLRSLDTGDVVPMIHSFERPMYLREDGVKTSQIDANGQNEVLKYAPETLNQSYKVPPIL